MLRGLISKTDGGGGPEIKIHASDDDSFRPYRANASFRLLTQDCALLVLGYYPFLPTGGAVCAHDVSGADGVPILGSLTYATSY